MNKVMRLRPALGFVARRVCRRLFKSYDQSQAFSGSGDYWERRYVGGGNSGVGSYGKFAEFKANVLNQFVAQRNVQRVIELGCGDGNQLLLARYPDYLGFDVSQTALARCREIFGNDPKKCFRRMSEYAGDQADLSLSLDVIYHLIENAAFEQYMRTLFGASTRYVIIYSSNMEDSERKHGAHVRHRKFTAWIHDHLPQWRLIEHLPNRYPYRGNYRTGSFAEFFMYEKTE